MNPSRFVEELKKGKSYRGQIVYETVFPARKAKIGTLSVPLPDAVQEKLNSLGLEKLYSHQARAIDLIRAGNNVIVVTGTASGKSLCYSLPVLEKTYEDAKATCLYLFPTKALGHDQLRVLNQFEWPQVRAATYDGDTPQHERTWVRRHANVVLTNPDMLHFGMLPHHPKWGDFFLNLKFVVIDEVHMLRGVFGSNCANIVRRLRRICDHYGSAPQFILSSATIANPHDLGKKLLGLDLTVVEDDGAPRKEKVYLFWNPPLLDERVDVRKSSNSEATDLFIRLSRAGLKNIVFSKSRQAAELIYRYGIDKLKSQARRRSGKGSTDANQSANSVKVASYRAGYLAKERREIEQKLLAGDVVGVSSTNALELGIDIGDLEACVINGFPGTVASFFQQAGRCGRAKTRSAVFLVGTDDALDQYYLKHPRELFGRPHELALIDPDNWQVFRSHLACAAYELPLSNRDRRYFRFFPRGLSDLIGQNEVVYREGRWFFVPPSRGEKFPAQRINIRSVSQKTFAIVVEDTGSLLGTVDQATALFYIHPGAVYLHQGDSYLVLDLDVEERVALVRGGATDYYTRPRDITDIKILRTLKKKRLGVTEVFLGEVEVTTEVIGFQKKGIYDGQILSEETLNLPPQQFVTIGLWFSIPHTIIDALDFEEKRLAGSIHAIEHAAVALLPFYAMCDRWDIGGVSTPLHYQTGKPTIFVYDGHEGGVGIAALGYKLGPTYLKKTLKLVNDCACGRGCPSCVQSPKCGNFNEPLDKKGALEVLTTLLKKPAKASSRGTRNMGSI